MSFPFPSHILPELVAARKVVRRGERFEVAKRGQGGRFDVRLEPAEGAFRDWRFLGATHDLEEPTAYKASLLLECYRLRGIDHHEVGRRRFYRDRVPPGWHEDVHDPNLPTGHEDSQRRVPLPGFDPTDFRDFIDKTAGRWNIDLELEAVLL